MSTIEVMHPSPVRFFKIYINDQLMAEEHECKTLITHFDTKLPVNIIVEFRPFQIKPKIRLDNFMLDYWLASILLEDHRVMFDITETFFQDYKDKNIQGRINYLTDKQKSVEHFYDKYVGVNNLHPELVDEIKKLISQ
jgi:hypothetical protein